jgi:GT2 family glycosyltransferase
MLKVAVVILNYNGKHWLQQFLPNVIANTTYPNAKIIIADNASTDDSVDFLKNNFSTIEIIQNTTNTGYAGGYNEALKHVDADIYCLLNSDVEVTENWIENILPIFDDNLVAAAQPKILAYHNKQTFEYAGAAGGFIDKYGYPFCRGRIFDTVEIDCGQYDNDSEIFWASGACLFIRSDIFHAIGGFDADFFAHMEEIDLCWRIKNLGYKIMYVHRSVIYHVGGGTLNKTNPIKTFLNFRNNRFLLRKNLDSKALKNIYFSRNILDRIAAFVAFLKGNKAEANAILNALTEYQKEVTKYDNKRLINEHFIKVHHIAKQNMIGRYNKSIIFAYFIERIKYFSQLKF